MSSVQQHLASIKNFLPTSEYAGLNKLYLLAVHEKPGLIKVGDTHRDVALRNAETCTNSSLHRSNEITFWLAQKADGTWYRDYDLHNFLTEKGYKREDNDQGNESEWFFIAEEDFYAELEEFAVEPVHKTVVHRPAQQYIIARLQKAIDEGCRYINGGLCVRVGKTIISLSLSAGNEWMPVYIGKNLTSQSSAESDNAEFGIVPEMLTQSIHGVDEIKTGDLSKRTKQIIKNIKRKNTDNKKVFFFVDEVDDASHTKNSRAIITPLVNYFKENDMFAGIMTMSGTRIERGEKILKELTNGPIKELSLEYYEMQILQPETTCNRNFRHISFYTESEDGLLNISDAMKNKNSGHKSLATFIEQLLGTNNFNFIVNENFPHWFIKFSTVGKSNANAFVRYLNRNCSVVENKEYHYAVINGDVTSAKEAQKYCKKIINDYPEKTCVFISQGMATTSFSVTEIGTSVVFSDNEVTADDTQALHRSATWKEGKDECNMLVVTTNGSTEYSFDDIFEDETKIAKTRGEKIEIYKELLNNNSMIHYTTNGKSELPVTITEQNADKMIDAKMKSMSTVASIIGVINDIDEEIMDNILGTVTTKKSTSKKSSSAKGDNFDPFGDNNVDDNNKKSSQKQSMTRGQKEKILRAFVEGAVNVPAIAREQETTLETFEFWDDIGIPKELFFDVYNSSWLFRDRIDAIYNLCEDENFLVENYISRI